MRRPSPTGRSRSPTTSGPTPSIQSRRRALHASRANRSRSCQIRDNHLPMPRHLKGTTLSGDAPGPDPDFSLVLGGPLYQLFRRTHLSGDALELLWRRILFISALAWLPLLVLSLFSGRALGDNVAIPFLEDIESQVRFLVALPLLVAAEMVVHRRLLPAVQQFVQRRIILPDDLAAFQRAVDVTLKLRNSIWIELGLIALVYTVGIWVWRNQVALESASWYAVPEGGGMSLTPAGYWFVFVSVPI